MPDLKKVYSSIRKQFLKGAILFALLLSALFTHAQTESLYSSYLFNGMAINPAYAGYRECLNTNLWGKTQWQGIEGAPSSALLSVHTPIPGKRISVGLNIFHEGYGVTRQTGAGGIYAYRLPISKKLILSSAIQGGVINISSNYSSLATKTTGDPLFAQNENRFLMDFNAGIILSSSRFFCGISAAHIQRNVFRPSAGSDVLRRQYFFSSGYLIKLSKELKLKPSVLVRATEESSILGDFNLNLLIREVLWAGISYRTNSSFIFLTQMKLSQALDLGYALDYGSTLSNSRNYISHELMLNYRFTYRKSEFITPRYF